VAKSGRLHRRGLIGSPPGWRKLATDARHDRSPLAGLEHSGFHLGQSGCGPAPFLEHQAGALQRARSLGHHPIGSTSVVNTASMMARRRRCRPAGQLAAHRGFKPRQAQPGQPLRVAITASPHHRQGGAPVGRLKRFRGGLKHPRPSALEQVAQLLHTCGDLSDQPAPACPQMPQPRPGLIGVFRDVAAQLNH
jgi:hypothetical protein